jgi:hypothetical protein
MYGYETWSQNAEDTDEINMGDNIFRKNVLTSNRARGLKDQK